MNTERLERDGATARAMGRDFLDNPFYKSENMPRATGVTIEDWQAKLDAWRRGWELENLVRPDPNAQILDRLINSLA